MAVDAQRPNRDLSRRNIVRSVAGVVALGTAGAGLAELSGSPAKAATTGTAAETGGLAPSVVNLTDAASIAVDASAGNDFRVTLGGNRTLATPSNPTDGQKITFQVTQGTGGPYTLTWGDGYAFASSLPQPTLSMAAGQTDLLGFIYNAAMGQWLFAGYINGFAAAQAHPTPTASSSPTVTPSPTGTAGSGTYRLFPSTSGPTAPVSYSGPFVCGVVAGVTAGGCWLSGYWWWVCPSGQSTSPQKFALWQFRTGTSGVLVPGSIVTSGSLSAGQWNFVPLPAPLPLAVGATYVASTGFSGSFPDTNSQFGSGGPYSSGIVNGPLTAYSDASGSLPSPLKNAQSVFSVAGSDPSVNMPVYGSSACNFWMDLEVQTNAPSGASYRLWPSYPAIPGQLDSDQSGYTLATEFQLAKSAQLNNIWFYSPPGATVLPSQCGIWRVGSQDVAPGTANTSPSWSGAAGSGWVSCSYSGVTLPAADYKVAVFNAAGAPWYQANSNYWTSGGTGASGITSGPVTAPGTGTASSPGQSTFHMGSWTYPQSYSGNGENFWVDVEVTPS